MIPEWDSIAAQAQQMNKFHNPWLYSPFLLPPGGVSGRSGSGNRSGSIGVVDGRIVPKSGLHDGVCNCDGGRGHENEGAGVGLGGSWGLHVFCEGGGQCLLLGYGPLYTQTTEPYLPQMVLRSTTRGLLQHHLFARRPCVCFC